MQNENGLKHLIWDEYDDEEMKLKWYAKIYDWWERYL